MVRLSRLGAPVAMTLVAAAIVVLGGAPARADIVVLADGRTLEGEVKVEGDEYVIKGRHGATTRVASYMVVEVRKTESPRDVFTKRRTKIEAKGEKARAEEWYELATFAAENNLKDEARAANRQVLARDPGHEGARKALGFVLHDGKWLPVEEAMARRGMVKVSGRWVPKAEAERMRLEGTTRRRRTAPRPSENARAAANALAPRLEDCMNCGGSGIAVWIPCHQCERSRRPGYCFNGQIFFLCPKCKGAARRPGIKCVHCRGSGKVNPDKPRTATGRTIGKGYRMCPDCSGTGAVEWIKCPQCARCKYPGYNYFGERYTICNKCKGAAKRAALYCARCQRSGLIPDTR